MRTPIIVLALAVISSTQPAPAPSSQFRDADRRTKLAASYADIDRLFSDFARGAHAPGAAWGIVVDGELAHAGGFGVRDVAAEGTRRRRYRLSYRVDDEELYRDGDPAASR